MGGFPSHKVLSLLVGLVRPARQEVVLFLLVDASQLIKVSQLPRLFLLP